MPVNADGDTVDGYDIVVGGGFADGGPDRPRALEGCAAEDAPARSRPSARLPGAPAGPDESFQAFTERHDTEARSRRPVADGARRWKAADEHAAPRAARVLIPENAPFSPSSAPGSTASSPALLARPARPRAGARPKGAVRPPARAAADARRQRRRAPWHDPAMPLTERMTLAEGRPSPPRLMAAMAQQDCGQCGYTCADYANALFAQGGGAPEPLRARRQGNGAHAEGARGGAHRQRGEVRQRAEAPTAAAPLRRATRRRLRRRGRSPRDTRSRRPSCPRRRLNGAGSEKETLHVEFDLSAQRPRPTWPAIPSASSPVTPPRSSTRVIAPDRRARERADRRGSTPARPPAHGRRSGRPPTPCSCCSPTSTAATPARARLGRWPTGEDADGDAANLDVLAALHKFRHGAARAEAFIEALDPAAAAALLDLVLAQADPGRVSLTVDAVRYTLDDRLRLGVASTFFADRVRAGDRVRPTSSRPTASRCPTDPTTCRSSWSAPAPASRRSAPFSRSAWRRGARARNWLFFGHQRRGRDFFYERRARRP